MDSPVQGFCVLPVGAENEDALHDILRYSTQAQYAISHCFSEHDDQIDAYVMVLLDWGRDRMSSCMLTNMSGALINSFRDKNSFLLVLQVRAPGIDTHATDAPILLETGDIMALAKDLATQAPEHLNGKVVVVGARDLKNFETEWTLAKRFHDGPECADDDESGEEYALGG